MNPRTILAIPFYKNEFFIENIGEYFSINPKEKALFIEILVINDCPNSLESSYLESACSKYNFNYLENSQNIGFLLSANIGIERAIKHNAHVVILNSDTIPTAGCFSELLSVFDFDSMVGCVCPRSNNATIANLWPTSIFANSKSDVLELAQAAKFIGEKMPKISYTPVVNGFCFAIRNSVIVNFGGFDEDFVPGYEEENEYCMRISESGYKVAIANQSFIGHLEGRSFALKPGRSELMEDNYQKIITKYPYYSERVSKYFASPEKKALDLLSQGSRANEDFSVLVDGRVLSCHSNGTMKVIHDVVVELSVLGYQVDLIADPTAAKFHNIDNLSNIKLVDAPRRYYDLGIKIAQPFEYHSLLTVPLYSKCPINIFFDTISIDCINLFDESVNEYWESLDNLYSLIFFISDHSKQQYINRYHPFKAECISLLLPINLDSKIKNLPSIIDGRYIFVVGNKFKHKGIEIALKQLPIKQGVRYVLLSEDLGSNRGDLLYLKPGLLTDDEMNALYENAEEVVFPSFSEGFGFPFIEALQYKKKIKCRPLKAFLEIYSTLPLKYQKLITFVDDFSKGGECINNPEPVINNFIKNEKEYLQQILNYSRKKIQDISFNELNKRLYIAENYLFKFTNKNSLSMVNLTNKSNITNPKMYSIAKKIYLRLMYYRHLQPLLLFMKGCIAKK